MKLPFKYPDFEAGDEVNVEMQILDIQLKIMLFGKCYMLTDTFSPKVVEEIISAFEQQGWGVLRNQTTPDGENCVTFATPGKIKEIIEEQESAKVSIWKRIFGKN